MVAPPTTAVDWGRWAVLRQRFGAEIPLARSLRRHVAYPIKASPLLVAHRVEVVSTLYSSARAQRTVEQTLSAVRRSPTVPSQRSAKRAAPPVGTWPSFAIRM